jgi:hypothetical protein
MLDVTTVNSYYGYGWTGVGVVARDVSVRRYDEGTLIIDVASASSNQLVWRGTAQAEVSMSAPTEQRRKKIYEATSKILERFPPGR